MERLRPLSLLSVVVVVVSTGATPALALQAAPAAKPADAKQAEPKHDAKPQGDKPAEPKAGAPAMAEVEPSLRRVPYEKAISSDVGARVWQRLRQLNRLHEEISKRTKLPPAQQELIRAKFENMYAQILETPAKSAWMVYAHPELSPEAKADLEAKLAAAEAAGDSKSADNLRLKILQGTYGTQESLAEPIEMRILDLKPDLDADQRDAMQYAYDRWYVLEPRSPFDNGFRMLLRAVDDPDLKLDPELAAKIRTYIQERITELPPPPQRRVVLADRAKETLAKVREDLTPAQRTIVDQHMANFEKERAAIEEFTLKLQRKKKAERAQTDEPGADKE